MLPEDAGGFVQYLWDDPTDDVPPRIEEGRASGDVPKLSYVVSFSDPNFLGGEKLIIGSGFHPGVSDDDDGCALAGAGSTSQGCCVQLVLDSVCAVFGGFVEKPLERFEVKRSIFTQNHGLAHWSRSVSKNRQRLREIHPR